MKRTKPFNIRPLHLALVVSSTIAFTASGLSSADDAKVLSEIAELAPEEPILEEAKEAVIEIADDNIVLTQHSRNQI